MFKPVVREKNVLNQTATKKFERANVQQRLSRTIRKVRDQWNQLLLKRTKCNLL